MTDFAGSLHLVRDYYNTGATLPYPFRKKQLLLLKNALKKYDDAINEALYTDLKKSKEEVWATETGLLISEINHALSYLKEWMKPEKTGTDLITFPSSAKIYKEPLGVVLIISPWNFPLQLLLIPLIGAIAAGNCVVLKPSEMAPATEEIVTKIIEGIFPGNYIKIITGNGAAIVPALMKQFRFDHIFFTGSTSVGKEIYKLAANDLIPVTLELGGKSPCIVYDDANIKVAARRIVLGKFFNVGQTCIAPDYVLVHQNANDTFLNEIRHCIREFYSDDASASYSYGKIINEKRFDTLISYIQPENIFYGGRNNREKLYIEPTVLTNISVEDNIMKEEVFGPILPVLSFATTGEAMNIVLRNEKPLSLYLFTSGKKVEKEWIRKIQFGGGCINNTVWHFTNKRMPFGGIGNSGIGAYHGKNTFDVFSHAKPVLKTSAAIDIPVKYPPFKNKLGLFKKFIR